MKRTSFRTRLVALGFAATAATLAVASGIILGYQWREARVALLDHLESTAAVVGANCTAALTFGDTAAAREALQSSAGVRGMMHAVLYRRERVIGTLGSYAVFAEFRVAGQPAAVRPAPVSPASLSPGRRLGRHAAEVVAPVSLDGSEVGLIYLRADTDDIDRRTLRDALAILLTALCALPIAWLLLDRFITRATRPIRELSALTNAVASTQDYQLRAAGDGDDELAALAAGLNQMLATIQSRDAALEAHGRSLEAEVAARTGDLEATNRRLQTELSVRHRAEQALVHAAHHWRATFDAMRDGVCVLDEEQRIVHANAALVAIIGGREEPLDGRAIRDVLAPLLGDVPELAGAGGEAMARTVVHAGGRSYELRRDRMHAGSGAAGHVLLVADVTAQRELQETLAQAQKMEAVGRLAAGVAHDFNNILSVILAFASSLAADLEDGELRSQAEEIERAGQRATALTRQLLAFSRRQVLRPQPLETGEVIANLTKMIARLIGEDIELAVMMGAGVGCVHMDPTQLEQVLVNLAVNARDAMPDGGKLTIEARDVELGGDARERKGLAAGPYVEVRVSDTGAGIEADTLGRIFEPFFTTKAKGKGTGLGLAMVYGAVEQSGGRIDVASEVGVGTAFTLYLPRVAAPATAPADAPHPAPLRGRGERVLVVEDEPQLRATLRHFLAGAGYEVLEAANGDEGLATFASDDGRIALVVTDLVMPGMGGAALGRAVLARRAVPVLYMSGYSEEVVSGKERIPPELFMQKPFDRGTLLGRVQAILATPTASRSTARA